jgi:uncharacterized membrane protein
VTNLRIAALVTTVSLAAAAGMAWGQSSFTLIQPSAGLSGSRVTGVSGDGTVVVGYSTNISAGAVMGYRWTRGVGREDFSNFPEIPAGRVADAVSGDGLTLVGSYSTGLFRWSASTGTQIVLRFPNETSTIAVAASNDGSVVVGYASVFNPPGPPLSQRAFRWTTDAGYQDLTGFDHAQAEGVSRDGNVAVGYTVDGRAFRWSTQDGYQALDSSGLGAWAAARGVSGDGSTIIGTAGSRPFRWTASTGMQDLGLPQGRNSAVPLHINFDGSVIACATAAGHYLWQQGSGYTPVETVLSQAGIGLPSGYTDLAIEGLSDDGRTIVGELTLGGSLRRGFVAVVPSPSGTAIVLGGLALASRRRRVQPRCA